MFAARQNQACNSNFRTKIALLFPSLLLMRLTHIKLAGFKSFTDPTTIHVPGQLVAVIGPNGCGKSNVIDAVRWVLGEASAKQLRGESMQDVTSTAPPPAAPPRAHRWSFCSTTPTKPCKARGGKMPK